MTLYRSILIKLITCIDKPMRLCHVVYDTISQLSTTNRATHDCYDHDIIIISLWQCLPICRDNMNSNAVTTNQCHAYARTLRRRRMPATIVNVNPLTPARIAGPGWIRKLITDMSVPSTVVTKLIKLNVTLYACRASFIITDKLKLLKSESHSYVLQ